MSISKAHLTQLILKQCHVLIFIYTHICTWHLAMSCKHDQNYLDNFSLWLS